MKKIFVILMLTALCVPAASALGVTPPVDIPIETPGDFIEFLESLLFLLWAVIVVLSIGVFLYAGFLFLTAGGNEDKVNQARDYIKYGLIGIVVAVFSWAIFGILMAFLQDPTEGISSVVNRLL